MGSELSCTQGKRGGGGRTGGGARARERDRVLSPLLPLVSPRFCFLREFFSRALLSERLEQANCEIWHFHVVVVQLRPRNVQESVMHVQSCCFANLNLLLYGSSRCRRLRRCLSSVLSTSRTAKSTQLQKPLCTSFIEHFTFLFIRSPFRGRI